MNIQSQGKRSTIRNLVIFIILVVAIGWIGRGLDILMGNPVSESLGMLLWIITPLGVSLLLRAFAGDGWKDFGIRLYLRGNTTWYVIALLVYPMVTALVLIVGSSSRLITFPNFSLNTPRLILQGFCIGPSAAVHKKYF